MDKNAATDLASYPSAERIGFAKLTRMAFDGADLRPLRDRKSTRLNSSHPVLSRMPSSA